ncbi:MAG TPA: NAD(P)H-dependent oxidoreductase subunit E [Denitromonas sp.]|uniref:NAD(P)H-dependent oxidoreductase subunit E n=1 Tax=Denitromonas sp. TaxID=2734609 RepID=UPI001DA8ED34|nr:NAD(P)H-dependent oxidoreductase subunit E [Rhodocyclaceae bacterium]MCP5220679.1 NAD(P)H-dependent oxidoreductase subunit E [Zoogloeaceae bacterium]HPR05163.1 NAD(P)H-dependent oxidoreductase subunit E [Denitromonas sp.]HQU88148.1 NAD(P)H-dependent oxidoreductase subunit E [Denitromonas sp.]HQV14324.1 NAD(P)H-dependent oxidoreductase subunit E [Denitromonas sp.]
MALGAWNARVDDVLKRFGGRPEHLLQMLIALQETENWLPPEALTALASALKLPRARVEGVVGFYSFLHAQPVGQYRLLFSDNIIDRMLGSEALMARLCHSLWLAPGQVSEDGLVSVDVTSCTGLGDQGPAMLVNGRAIAALNEDRIDIICELIRQKLALDAWPAELFELENTIHQRDALLSCAAQPGDALQAAIAMGRDAWLSQVQVSRLRGRGGAGFTTAVKWLACRDAPATEKIVVCNADEGEPGTFKDRVLLNAHADLVFEGMTLAAWAVGARRGFLYLRGEYLNLRPALEATLARRRAEGWLGASIGGAAGFDFDIEIHLGAGAYVCGEETALLESLEGKRGTPRIRPPFPVTHGYLGLPTVVNNVETLAKCCLIALNGGAAFAATGTAQSAGTKLLSVSGDCERPGIYEFPFGVTVRQVLDACGATDTLAVQVGGAAGITLAPYEFGRRVAFEDVPTAGAFMVFNDTRDMFEVAHNFVRFFAHESCGFCTPCRVGTSLLAGTLDKLAEGKGSPADLLEIEDLDRLLKQASHCGLGSAAPNPVIDGLQKFRPAYERHLMHADFSPAFDLDGALRRARQITGRDDAGAHLPQQPEASR